MRGWVLLLVVANLAFFVWTQGWVSPWLPAPWQGQREPQRVLEQLNPERVAVRRAEPASAPAAAAAASAASPGAAPAASAVAPRTVVPASAPKNSAR